MTGCRCSDCRGCRLQLLLSDSPDGAAEGLYDSSLLQMSQGTGASLWQHGRRRNYEAARSGSSTYSTAVNRSWSLPNHTHDADGDETEHATLVSVAKVPL